jgi:hypothetical protein
MIRFPSRDPVEPLLFDPPRVVRVSIPWIGFEGLLNPAFAEIRLYAHGASSHAGDAKGKIVGKAVLTSAIMTIKNIGGPTP